MIAKHCTIDDLQQALRDINLNYGDNIRFKTLEGRGRNVIFTLTVNDTKGPGGRIGHSGRHIKAACWHVHGDFFDALFKLVPSAEVVSLGRRINKEEGNWKDWNIGSIAFPLMYSEACDCGKFA